MNGINLNTNDYEVKEEFEEMRLTSSDNYSQDKNPIKSLNYPVKHKES
jgi:hypothetical protein